MTYRSLNRYISKEFITSFLVAFIFFFFIFFVNQILVLAQRVLLKNVNLGDVLLLVVFSIPQFLMYTMPFSSLSAASMSIGNLSSQNEVLAMRSLGIPVRKLFRPILIVSLILSLFTLVIADRIIPATTQMYRDLYAKILQSLPTVELEPYGTTQFGKRVISNGAIPDGTIHDIIIYDNTDGGDSKVITAKEGTISLINLDEMLYRLDLVEPELAIMDENSLLSYHRAKAQSMTLNLSLSSSSSGLVSITPSQMSIRELMEESEIRKPEAESGNTFYYAYYRSEMHKKIALSAACTFLVFVAFPISFFKIRNGRLIGFGISMLVACGYWFFIYFMQVRAITSSVNSAILMWAPNILIFIAGILLLWKVKK